MLSLPNPHIQESELNKTIRTKIIRLPCFSFVMASEWTILGLTIWGTSKWNFTWHRTKLGRALDPPKQRTNKYSPIHNNLWKSSTTYALESSLSFLLSYSSWVLVQVGSNNPILMSEGYLLFGGDKGPGQVYYGLAGAILSCAALTLFIFLVLWLVLRVSFTITQHHFRIVKSGILR